MTAQERIEWMDRVWPVGEAVARSAMKDIIADLASVEVERGTLRAKGEKLAEAILACKALFTSVLEEWRKE
jgi:hypothetical protein